MLSFVSSHLLCGMLASACIVVIAKRFVQDYREYKSQQIANESKEVVQPPFASSQGSVTAV
jgi:hypothetical protein